MKRRLSSSGEHQEPRTPKRKRSKSHSESRLEEPREIDNAARTARENLDENQAPAENQEEIQVEESQADEEVIDKRIIQAVRRYEKDDYAERDLWDTVLQLAHQQSQDLSRSLVHWGRTGGLRDSRSSKQPANKDLKVPPPAPENLGTNTDDSEVRIFDPTASSFTLWPLPLQSCPAPEWTLNEELSALVTRTERECSGGEDADSALMDNVAKDEKTDALVGQNRKTLMQLLNDLYEFHPPHTSSIPIFTRGKRYKKLAKSMSAQKTSTQSTDPKSEGDADFGLNWQFVLGVASSTLNVKESVIQRARERLAEMYRVPLESLTGQEIHNSSHSQPFPLVNLDPAQRLQRYRQMKPLATPDDQS
ncbi:hypothetical protein PTTG_29174 [Puccinia triticina 1-1 BBBD Race 1]|uniref:Uncharacterized protein n=2 Tax=Puccinia triticina TaxID=208348 RepID=A0A180G5T3_PUCT1|nr:uncharacterized protein PtA15_2A740 [Puccinia triticina]OAV88045.1 hypothetical protein PTTG_29174 [Puccinia triticina 1-1 BBBD Race 1]WAQ82423.1 hypothetical protein PtA15_2A740 [Puccinia triticina]WAR53277.1 hypothetical protein PtB15_2B708 [Puccinia triticina]